MEAAKKRGVIMGRPRKLSPKKIEWARQQLNKNPPSTLSAIATRFGVSARTLSRMLRET